MNYSTPVKKLSVTSFLSPFQQKGRTTRVTFESLPKPRTQSRFMFDDFGHSQTNGNPNRFKSVPSLRPFSKSLQVPDTDEIEDDFKTMATFNTHIDLPRDDDEDLAYTPYQYEDDDFYDIRPQTSYLAQPFASRNRGLESIAECRTPTSSSSASSRGGDVTPDSPEYYQILDVKREKVKPNSNEYGSKSAPSDSKLYSLPRIQQDQVVTPVKVKTTLSLRANEKLPNIANAFRRIESSETFLAHSKFSSGQNRAESVESIRTPSTSRHLLWSRGSIMSDGGFPKARSETNMTKLSFQSEPTPTFQSLSPLNKGLNNKKKVRKLRRKPATKFYVPYRSFLESVASNRDNEEKKKSKKHIKSAKFTLYFPSLHKKCTISPIIKEGNWCQK